MLDHLLPVLKMPSDKSPGATQDAMFLFCFLVSAHGSLVIEECMRLDEVSEEKTALVWTVNELNYQVRRQTLQI